MLLCTRCLCPVYLLVVNGSLPMQSIMDQVWFWLRFTCSCIRVEKVTKDSPVQLIVVATHCKHKDDLTHQNIVVLQPWLEQLKSLNTISDWAFVSGNYNAGTDELLEKISALSSMMMKTHPASYKIPSFYDSVLAQLRMNQQLLLTELQVEELLPDNLSYQVIPAKLPSIFPPHWIGCFPSSVVPLLVSSDLCKAAVMFHMSRRKATNNFWCALEAIGGYHCCGNHSQRN